MRDDVGILFLPSGPGLNSAPAQVFLTSIFRHYGPAFYWDEPSEQRGQIIPEDPKAHWRFLVDALEAAADTLPEKIIFVTESFGSVLSEVFFRRLREKGKQNRVLGALHSPPVLDLRRSFRKILHLAEKDFIESGEEARLVILRRLIRTAEAHPALSDSALLEAMAVAFESPRLLPRFFQNLSKLDHWSSAFGEAGFAPEPEMREKVLRGMTASGVQPITTFLPDIPTWVCAGDEDPYQSREELEDAVSEVNARPGRVHKVRLTIMDHVSYYPYVDRPEDWEREVFAPFWQSVGGV